VPCLSQPQTDQPIIAEQHDTSLDSHQERQSVLCNALLSLEGKGFAWNAGFSQLRSHAKRSSIDLLAIVFLGELSSLNHAAPISYSLFPAIHNVICTSNTSSTSNKTLLETRTTSRCITLCTMERWSREGAQRELFHEYIFTATISDSRPL